MRSVDLDQLDGPRERHGAMLYGAGPASLECCRLRIKDVDFGASQIVVRWGKGDNDRVTMLPGRPRWLARTSPA